MMIDRIENILNHIKSMIWFLKLYFCFWCSGDTLSAFLWWYIHQTLTKIRRTGESSTALQCIVRANGGIPETALKHSKQVAWLRWPRVPRANHTQANFLRIYVEQECWDGWGGGRAEHKCRSVYVCASVFWLLLWQMSQVLTKDPQ